MSLVTDEIRRLADGKLSSKEIGALIGVSPRYVRKVMARLDLPQLHCGAQPHEKNHQFLAGRRIDLGGYVLVSAPHDHPYARQRPHRQGKIIYEHRLALELKLGRYLLPAEVPDHIDGLTLHNNPSNLRLFSNNREHLQETLSGKRPAWSEDGLANLKLRHQQPIDSPVDMHRQRKARGEIRLRQILLAALSLGIDSPYLLGTHHHLTHRQIDWNSRPNLKRALDDLYAQWGWCQLPS